MTTPRTRRSKPQQARDILLALLKDQEAEAAKHKAAYEEANLRASSTRRTIELLDQTMLPGMEPEPPVGSVTITGVVVAEAEAEIAGTASDLRPTDLLSTTAAAPRPYRQRIGEKTQHINDVWESKDGFETVTVHTALMYERQEACALCRAGVPFTTEERTAHHFIILDQAGVERGFRIKPCTGIKGGRND